MGICEWSVEGDKELIKEMFRVFGRITVTEKFSDKDVSVAVPDDLVDDLTDWCEERGLKANLLGCK